VRGLDRAPQRVIPFALSSPLEIPALPKLPLMFTFYDADEDFPAEAKVLYDAAALDFLDLECLAVLGGILVEELEKVR